MAITCTAVYQPGDTPSGASAITDPGIASTAPKQEIEFAIAASGVANSSAATGFDNLMSAIETYGAGTLATALGLDSTATVAMVIYVRSVSRAVSGSTIWQTGTDNYNISGLVQWEVS